MSSTTEQGDLDDRFQQFWQAQQGKLKEEQLVVGDADAFDIHPSIDWNLLQEVALRETILERIWRNVDAFSYQQIATYAIVSVVFSPFLLVVMYQWAMFKMSTGVPMQMVLGVTLLLVSIGISSVLIGAPVYLIYKRFPRPFLINLPLPISHLDLKLSLFAGIVVIVGLLILFDSFKISPYRSIPIDGRELVVLKEYYGTLLSKTSSLQPRYQLMLQDSSVLDLARENSEFLNAVAVELELRGDLYDAEVAYSLAGKVDPLGKVSSYQVNTKSANHLRSLSTLGLSPNNRYISKDFQKYFESKETVKQLLDSLEQSNVRVNDPLNLNTLNVEAVAYEYLGNYDQALGVYHKLLQSEDNTVARINFRKMLESQSLPAVPVK